MRLTVLLFLMSLSIVAVAQSGPCTEQVIRKQDPKNPPVADDAYFAAPSFAKPTVGEAAYEQAAKAVLGTRNNYKQSITIDRVVAAPSGDMAYEYGTTHVTYDDGESGKHIDRTAAFLQVWRVDRGACKEAAIMFEYPDAQSPTHSTISK